jgi:hypothetical protein
MSDKKRMVIIGGWSLIAFAVLFIGFQLLFLMFFEFQGVVYGGGRDVLPSVVAGGTPLQVLLILFSLLPLLLVPAAVGSYYAFRDANEPAVRTGVLFATLAAIALSFSLFRLPSLHFIAAKFLGQMDLGQQAAAGLFFHSLDSYVGTFLGGIFSKVALIVWFFIISFAMLRVSDFPKWIGYLGIITTIYLLLTLLSPLGFFPEFIDRILALFAPLEFIWLLLFGVGLLFYKEPN